ncbi:MAG: HlyD family efflux transporter periplasmic adaptor subunit, partial [Candidatus Aureabacteria bacterium]|nr:HlyD family efflux transporter periplasmic adaptor subunit [Candidatus Auribacterota bacterium]
CPIDGFVLEKYAEPGEVVPLGGPIYKVADLSRFWLKIYMAEPDLGKMVLGMHVKVRMDAVKEPIMGKITWVASESEFTPKNVQTRTSRSELVYAVKVTLEKSLPELKIGMPAEVYFQ